jgi:hypothetical protein
MAVLLTILDIVLFVLAHASSHVATQQNLS